MTLVAALLAAPGIAQQSSQTSPATPDQPAAPPAAADQNAVATPSVVATPAVLPETSNPNLTIAAVKLVSGYRASKLIGSTVYNDQNQKIGSIDDLIVTPDEKITTAVISVGGFLGMGSKLVAVPYDQLRLQTKDNGERFELPGATKEGLNAMPNFTYGNG